MSRFRQVVLVALLLSLILLSGCQHLVIDTDKIVRSDTDLPEIVGIIAGLEPPSPLSPTFWR